MKKRNSTKHKSIMKYIFTLTLLVISNLTFGQINSEKDSLTSNSNYDTSLAEKLGGDDYGMKSYFLVILKTGTNTTADQELIDKSFRGHLDHINHLVDERKLILAGPLDKNENNYRGIFILNNIKTIDEAKEMLQTDPAIHIGLLDYELFTWYGSAALPEYLPFSDKIWKSKP
ncbi:MAG: YciI family protein [Nitritalea sp.]